MPRFNPLVDQTSTYPFVRILARKQARLDAGLPVYDFGMGDPVEPTPEFIRRAALDALKPVCPYPTAQGRPEVRAGIAAYLRRRFGVTVDPEVQVLPTAGSKEAVFHLPMLVVDRDAADRVVVFPDPGYPAYQRGALFAGAEAHAVLLEGDYVFRPWELPAELLARTRLMWLNNPHNPSGAITSLAELRRAAELAREYDFLLVCDETYADVWDDRPGAGLPEPPHSLLEAGVENVLVLHSLSKRSGMTGYRSGFLAGDPAVMRKLRRFRANPGLAPQDFVNAAALAAWSDDAHVAERRAIFNAKRGLLLDFFAEAGLEVVGSRAAIYIWLRVPPGAGTDEDWAEHLLEHGIVVSPGRMFGVAGGGAGFVRLALVPALDEIRAAIEVWRGLL